MGGTRKRVLKNMKMFFLKKLALSFFSVGIFIGALFLSSAEAGGTPWFGYSVEKSSVTKAPATKTRILCSNPGDILDFVSVGSTGSVIGGLLTIYDSSGSFASDFNKIYEIRTNTVQNLGTHWLEHAISSAVTYSLVGDADIFFKWKDQAPCER